MKKINHILFIMAATAVLMIAGCRKDNPDDKTSTDETITADFDLTILDYRGWNPKLYTWTWKDGALHTGDQKIQTLDITSDKRLVLLATSGNTQFKGVHFDVPDGVEIRKATDAELKNYRLIGYPDYPANADAWEILWKEGVPDGMSVTIGVNAGTVKKTFKANVVKEIPIDHFKVHVTTNKGYSQMFEWKSMPKKMLDNLWDSFYWNTEEGKALMAPYIMYVNKYSEVKNGDLYVSMEITGYEPENTTYRTIQGMDIFAGYDYMWTLAYPHPEWQEIFASHKDFLSALNGKRDIDGLLNAFRFTRTFGNAMEFELEYAGNGCGTIRMCSRLNGENVQYFQVVQACTLMTE